MIASDFTERPNLDAWAMRLAHVTAERSTCYRRRVGCVLLNARGHVVATGYNGVPRGDAHCNEITIPGQQYWVRDQYVQATVAGHLFLCPGATASSGAYGGLSDCRAVHAETNALIQCSDVWNIMTCYVTVSPCFWCVRMLANTSCTRIVFAEAYAHEGAQSEWLTPGGAQGEWLTPGGSPGASVRKWEHYGRSAT